MIIEEKIEEEKMLIEHLNAECFKNENTRRSLHNAVQDPNGNMQTPAEKDVPLTEIKYPGECESKRIMIGSVVKDYLNKKKNIFKE